MGEKRLKISEFADLVGCSAKAVYGKIERKELVTDSEVKNGRKITVIVTNDNEIKELQKVYGKLPVNEVHCEDILTDNESNYTSKNIQNQSQQVNMSEIFDRIITLNEGYNETLLRYSEELVTVKSKQLLLEDKAGREGFYLNEINTVKEELNTVKIEKAELSVIKEQKERQLKVFTWLITVISLLLIVTVISLIIKLANPTIIEKQVLVDKKAPVNIVQKPVNKGKIGGK